MEWISTLSQRDTVFPSYHPYSISADLPVGHCPGILAVPFAVACHSTPARCRTDPVYHPVNRAEKLRGPLEFPVEHPYYQPSSQAGQEQPSQPYGQGYNPEQPYYQPSPQAGSQSYGQNYPSGQPSHSQAAQSNDLDQPQAQYPERMPPMQQ
ncbi:MAG: hypothetical protein E6J31_15415 [Chloroflexi bacterium]|nr:MAG: hypothetical protein E6J31_15415 [Chloroflexota bacterium]